MSISTLSCVCAFENLARFQAREYLPFGKNEGITDRILTILESRPFSGHASGNASRSNLGGSEVRKFRKKTALATRTTHSSKRVAEPSYRRQPSNYFLVPTRGRSTRHYAASPPALCSFPPFLLFFSPIYISLYPPSLPSLFLLPLRPLRVPYERTGAAKHCRRGRRKEGNHLPLLLLLPLIPREE